MTIVFAYDCGYGTWRTISRPPPIDFVSYWAAARLALTGNPSGAYDNLVHGAVEATVTALNGALQPFPYPPPFLLFVVPFGLLPFTAAFATWTIVTCTLFYFAFRRIAPWPFTFAWPGGHMNALIGQNGFLTAGLFAIGATLLETEPFAAGAILGVLVVKPQLALLLPVAVIATRNWRAVAGALLTSSILLLLALAAFGLPTYEAFLSYLPVHGEKVAAGVPLVKLASVSAGLLFLGLPAGLAIAGQTFSALGAAAATWVAWARRLPTRVPILAAATLLVPPYLFAYDTLLLLLPLGWLIRHGRRPRLVALIWLLSLVPLAAPIYPGPNTIPICAVLSIWAMFREAQESTHQAISSIPAEAGAALSTH